MLYFFELQLDDKKWFEYPMFFKFQTYWADIVKKAEELNGRLVNYSQFRFNTEKELFEFNLFLAQLLTDN